jgi:hypothetical protein
VRPSAQPRTGLKAPGQECREIQLLAALTGWRRSTKEHRLACRLDLGRDVALGLDISADKEPNAYTIRYATVQAASAAIGAGCGGPASYRATGMSQPVAKYDGAAAVIR